MNKAEYILEKWQNGWLVCRDKTSVGIPASALMEITTLLQLSPKAVINQGIAHHYQKSGKPEVVLSIGEPEELSIWEKEIMTALQCHDSETQWWLGLNVGMSSAAIFAVFSTKYKYEATEFSKGATPHDSSDLQRCFDLLSIFPQWEIRIKEVATAYPETKWPKIIDAWSSLKKLSPKEQYAFLSKLD